MSEGTTAARDSHRQQARAGVDALLAELRRAPDGEEVARAREIAEHLARAIEAFHMEAIRFRMYTLDRLLATGQWSAEVRRVFAEVKAHLEAAGFHTRSVPH